MNRTKMEPFPGLRLRLPAGICDGKRDTLSPNSQGGKETKRESQSCATAPIFRATGAPTGTTPNKPLRTRTPPHMHAGRKEAAASACIHLHRQVRELPWGREKTPVHADMNRDPAIKKHFRRTLFFFNYSRTLTESSRFISKKLESTAV